MITIDVKDWNGTPCQLGDVLIFHYRSPRMKYVGILQWLANGYQLVVSDGEGWYALSEPFKEFERLCNIEECPALRKELGKIHLTGRNNINKLYKLAEQAINKNNEPGN